MRWHLATSSSSATPTRAGAVTASRSWCIGAMPISATAIQTASASSTCAIQRTRDPLPSCPARPTPAPFISRPMTICCSPSTGRACGRCRSIRKPIFSGSSADLLKGQQYTAGIRVFDIARPEAPREIAFMPTEGVGPHHIWYVGGRYAYVSIHYPEFTDHVLATPALGPNQRLAATRPHAGDPPLADDIGPGRRSSHFDPKPSFRMHKVSAAMAGSGRSRSDGTIEACAP